MVAPSNSSIAKFLASPPASIQGFLLYGTDGMQISARAQALARILVKAPDAEILRLHDSDISAEPERISSELATRSLFGGKRIIWLTSFPAKAHAFVSEAISAGPLEASLIVQAPDLKKAHKITQAFEASANLAAIACYGEDQRSLAATLRQTFADLGHQIDADAISLLITRSDSSALIAEREAEKISAFAGAGNRVSLTDVEACIMDQQTSESYDAVNAALDGNVSLTLQTLQRFLSVDQAVTPLLLAMISGLQRLHSLRAAVDLGGSVQQAIKSLRPPVFYKQQDAIERQFRLWTSERLAAAIRQANETTKATRLKPQLAEPLTVNFFLTVSRLARSTRL